MARARSAFLCPACGDQGFLTRKKRFSKLLGREVTYFYVVHARKDVAENRWKRYWHYIGTDHMVEVKDSKTPVRALSNMSPETRF